MFAWKTFPDRLPMYIYPLVLVLIEIILRSLSFLQINNFIGPTLAAVGVSFILPLTIKKPLTLDRMRKYPAKLIRQLENLSQKGLPVQYVSSKETFFIQICWTSIIVLTFIWIWTIYLAIKFPNDFWNYFPGFINYFIGLVLSEIHEVV